MFPKDKRLFRAALFSLSLHSLFFVPAFFPGAARQVETDVVSGISSIEMEFLPGPVAENRQDGEDPFWVKPQKKTQAQPAWLQDAGAQMDFRRLVFYNPAPVYPRVARIQGWQGQVLVRVLVGPDGRAGETTLARSSGFSVLDEAALTALHEWRFHSEQKGGRSLARWVEIPVVFKLENRSQETGAEG